MTNKYCSVIARQYNEQIFATTPHFTKLLLVEYNATWGENPLVTNRLPKEVNSYLANFNTSSTSIKTLFIKNKRNATPEINIFAVNNLKGSSYVNHFKIAGYKQLLDFSEDDFFSATRENRFLDLLYLVCTNGKRDRCCSKFGIPIVKELSKITAHVWECTHLGGHRFAPNVVVAPYCLFYGTLGIEDLPTLVRLTNDQRMLLDKCRGRSCNSAVEQAAEYYLRKAENNVNIFDYEVVRSAEISSQVFEVEIRNTKTGAVKLITIQQGQEPIKRRFSCNADKEEYPKTYELVRSE